MDPTAALGEIERDLRRVASGFDPHVLLPAEAQAVVERACAVENMAALLKTQAAKVVADSGAWKRDSSRSAAESLAKTTGTSVGRAQEILDTGVALDKAPTTAAAAATGALSPEKIAAVASAAAANPAAEHDLLAKATDGTPLPELRRDCTRAKTAADRDPNATYERVRKERRLAIYESDGGIVKLFGASTPDQMARIRAAIERRAEELFQAARRSGAHEPRAAYLIDALDQICSEWLDAQLNPESAVVNAPSAKYRKALQYLGLIRVDHSALVRGFAELDERCEITGLGPISVPQARLLLGDAVLNLIVTKGVDVANVVTDTRYISPAQRAALLWDKPTCEIHGCTNVIVEIDHDDPFGKGGKTTLRNLQHLCTHHHRLKTAGWEVVQDEHEHKHLVAPDDPRHPENRSNAPPGVVGVFGTAAR